jgi:hypothetical protein
MKAFLTTICLLALAAVPAHAQESAKPAAPPADQGKPAPERRAPEPKLQNLKLDLTITDQKSGSAPAVKTVTIVMSDSAVSRIRTSGSVLVNGSFRDVVLNIDARAEQVRDGRIRANITIEYKPKAAEAATEQATVPAINEMLTVLLEDGVPLVISQSADPVTDRAVKVEAKATILK